MGIWESGAIFPLDFAMALNTAPWGQERIFQLLAAFSGHRLSADGFKNVCGSAMSPPSITHPSSHENSSEWEPEKQQGPHRSHAMDWAGRDPSAIATMGKTDSAWGNENNLLKIKAEGINTDSHVMGLLLLSEGDVLSCCPTAFGSAQTLTFPCLHLPPPPSSLPSPAGCLIPAGTSTAKAAPSLLWGAASPVPRVIARAPSHLSSYPGQTTQPVVCLCC